MRAEVEAYVRARAPLLYLVTWEEERVLRELEAVAGALKKPLHTWTETGGLRTTGDGNGEHTEDRRLREPAAVLGRVLRDERPGLYALVDFHPYVEQPLVRRLLRDLAHALVTSGKTLVLVSPRLALPFELQKEVTVVEVPLPSHAELDEHLDAITAHLRASGGEVQLDRRERDELVRSAQGMTLQELEQTLALAVVKAGRVDRQVIPLVLAEKEQIVKKSTALEYARWDQGFEAVGGLDQLKAFLRARRDAFSEEARSFGLPAPRGICLIGVQGCGKSLSAKAVARFYRLPLLRFDIGRVFAGIVGRSEENVRAALKLAEQLAPCVLWIDELEKSLAGVQSSGVSDGGTTARVISTITTWLQERGGDGVYVVATANDISRLPPELVRKGRFDEIFFVDLPTTAEREEVLSIHLRRRERDPADFDLGAVARAAHGFSGAELEEVVIAGLYEAFAGRRPLTTGDLLGAVEQTVPLSLTMHERVAGIRAWAEGRARRASSAMDDARPRSAAGAP
ncbi:MAG: AAA family ATPase [Planctomycetes bacterium]|nr:AAA family ATPase [Planctomycetota bacterium]